MDLVVERLMEFRLHCNSLCTLNTFYPKVMPERVMPVTSIFTHCAHLDLRNNKFNLSLLLM